MEFGSAKVCIKMFIMLTLFERLEERPKQGEFELSALGVARAVCGRENSVLAFYLAVYLTLYLAITKTLTDLFMPECIVNQGLYRLGDGFSLLFTKESPALTSAAPSIHIVRCVPNGNLMGQCNANISNTP